MFADSRESVRWEHQATSALANTGQGLSWQHQRVVIQAVSMILGEVLVQAH